MTLVRSIDQIDDNARTLISAAFGSGDDQDTARSLIARGSVFYPFEYEGILAFVPSRFIGYQHNSIAEHDKLRPEGKKRDGKKTNPAIRAILGSHRPDEELQAFYLQFCDALGVKSKGRFPKKFWRIETTKRNANAGKNTPGKNLAINDDHPDDEQNDDPKYKDLISRVYVRDDNVRRKILERADGRCEYKKCSSFTSKRGVPYLEAHHVIHLSAGGKDHDSNVIALCPSHHREAHYGQNWESLNAEFMKIVAEKMGQ